jgi:hypothetical protein
MQEQPTRVSLTRKVAGAAAGAIGRGYLIAERGLKGAKHDNLTGQPVGVGAVPAIQPTQAELGTSIPVATPDVAVRPTTSRKKTRRTAQPTGPISAVVDAAFASDYRTPATQAPDFQTQPTRSQQRRDRNPWIPASIALAGVLITSGLVAVAVRGNDGTTASASGSNEPSGSPSGAPRTDGPSTSPSIAPSIAASVEPSQSNGPENTFPTTREALVAALGGNVNPDFVMKGYSDGKPNGTWQIEAFPLLDGVTANANGDYVDANGNVLTDPGKVYKFSAKPQWINSLTLTIPRSYLFARSGGDVPSGQQANISRFDGTMNSTMTGAFEQAALIPTADCDPATAAWRDATNNFTWNGDAQKGTIKVEWFNPETNKLQQIDGRMVAAYSKAGIDIASLIQEMPANYPITPDQAASDTGGSTSPSKWTLDAKNGTWTYEGFAFALNISYDANRGVHTDRKGNVITDLTTIFGKFDKYDVNTWPTSMTAANIQNTYTFMRTGGASQDQANTSWYSNDKTAVVTLKGHGFEQAAIILIPPAAGCSTQETVIEAMVKDAIISSRNPNITTLLWDGKDWINPSVASPTATASPSN